MSYQVDWLRRAERDLAEIWFATRFRAPVEQAARIIDDALRVDAMNVGESRERDDRRILIVWPLIADVEVQVQERRCVVARIRVIESH